jgi:hypothetical protein
VRVLEIIESGGEAGEILSHGGLGKSRCGFVTHGLLKGHPTAIKVNLNSSSSRCHYHIICSILYPSSP